MNKRRIEREFGVPIAGEILEPELWTHCALKKLPTDGPIDPALLFERTAPLVLDIGCGNGRYLIGSAVWRTTHDHLGIDVLPLVLRYATRRANQRGLKNIRFAAVDGQRLVGHFLAPGSVREVHCYHPQPYHNPAEANKRLIIPQFLATLVQIMDPEGTIYLQTDNRPYWDYILRIVSGFFEFQELSGPWPDSPRGRTRREILDLKRGVTVYRGWGRVLTGLTFEEACRRAESLPLADFNAGPRLRDIDDAERET